MRLFVELDSEDAGDGRSVAISIESDEATVGDLAAALWFSDPSLSIDGVDYRPGFLLNDVALVEGSVVQLASTLRGSSGPTTGIGHSWIGVVGGPNAGIVKRIHSDGSFTIGRGSTNDLNIDNSSVSARHVAIDTSSSGIQIRDLGSTNGTWVDGESVTERTIKKGALKRGASRAKTLIRVGSSTIEFAKIDSVDQPLATAPSHADGEGRILFNRPPRGPVPEAPPLVEVPDALPERKNPTLRILSLLIPIALAVVMVLVLGSFRFALFALLSPAMLLGTWLSGRHAVKKERSGDVVSRKASLAKLRADIEAAEQDERLRRREYAPNLLEVRRRIELPSSRMWERRLDAPDAMTIRLGVGTCLWHPTKELAADADDEVKEALAGSTALTNIEVLADLREGPIGFLGDQDDARKATRSALLQLVAHHGPADINIAILTTAADIAQWQWAQWLPHTSTGSGGVQIFTGAQSDAFATSMLDELGVKTSRSDAKSQSQIQSTKEPILPGLLVVIDDLDALHQKSSPIRRLIERTEQNVFAVVLAPVQDQLPASVATVVSIGGQDGEFERRQPACPGMVETGVIDGVSALVAEELARSLARFDDPETATADGHMSARVGPRDILSDALFGRDAPNSIRQRWLAQKHRNELITPLGLSSTGPFNIDLVHDGPHALVAGTTGAGKSELLRTAVVGLALNHDPDDLVFVLIDYKGGSAFDKCATLPHVVGLVTDLDDHLAERALQSLEAELHHRETILRRSECSDITEYRNAASPMGPMPRLVVVIDEFATLRSELPDFVKSLIGIAQRGRSLGVHLILATQRPSGAIDANIRANTNLRIALRVQDNADSTDVIDDPGAARIDRDYPGRALVRRGDGELSLVQTAYVSGGIDTAGPPVLVGELAFGGAPPTFPATNGEDETTHLESLVDVICKAAGEHAAPRRPWLADLPNHIWNPEDLATLVAGDDAHVVLAVGDDPMAQRRVTRGWNFDEGHLAIIGGPGSGVTTTIRSAITALGAPGNDRSLWVFPVDHGTGGLGGIDSFDHVANVIDGAEEARQSRLLQFVSITLDERRSRRGDLSDLPLIVVAIDGMGAFSDANSVESGTANGDLLSRIGRDGPSVGIYLLLGSSSLDELPRSIRKFIHQFVLLEQSDPRTFTDFAIRTKNLPSFVPGRALLDTTPMVGQVIDWEHASRSGALDMSAASKPPSMDGLADEVSRTELPAAKTEPNLSVPFGLSDSTRTPASLELRSGEHALIAGPSRSGRTNALRVIGAQLREADRSLVLVGVVSSLDRSLLSNDIFDAGGTPEEMDAVLAAAFDEQRRWVVLVDDAEGMDLDAGALVDIVRKSPANVSVIAAVRSSSARQNFGHWTRFVRGSGTGILLEPDQAVDGELLGIRLPREQRLDAVPGRGYLVSGGQIEVVQVAV